MIALALETSAAVGSVALAIDGRSASVDLAERRQTRSLAVEIDGLLVAASRTPRDIDLIAVGLGPGGYTGLRLGVVTARTLAVVLELPILGVPSTAVLAAHPDIPPGRVLVVMDARKGYLYGACYHKAADGMLSEELAPFCRPIDRVAAATAGELVCVGDGAGLLAARLGGSLITLPIDRPRALELLLLAEQRFQRGERDDERTLLPLYLRPAEAELRWRERQADPGGGPGAENS